MRVLIHFFARARELAQTASVEVDLPEGSRVGDLRRHLAGTYPAVAGLLARSALAMDEEFAPDEACLRPDAVVAVLPPVSGGQ